MRARTVMARQLPSRIERFGDLRDTSTRFLRSGCPTFSANDVWEALERFAARNNVLDEFYDERTNTGLIERQSDFLGSIVACRDHDEAVLSAHRFMTTDLLVLARRRPERSR